MTHVLFLVHGMGVYGTVADGKYRPDQEGWFAEAEKSLRDIYDKLIKSTGMGGDAAFDDHFLIERVEYDSWFERYRTDWEFQSKSWSAFDVSNDVIKGMKRFFEGNSAESFLWTHVADVLLYATPLIRDAVHPHLAHQIFTGLKKHAAAGRLTRWSVIAHSLGSAAVHNTLAGVLQMARNDAELAGVFIPPEVVCMASNVTRALSPAAAAYGPGVAPTPPDGPVSYISCNHQLDPFCRLAPFDPPAASPFRTAPRFYDLSGLRSYYLAKEVIDWAGERNNFDRFASVVPHGFGHYMRQPEVIATLWPCLWAAEPIDHAALLDEARTMNRSLLKEEIKAEVENYLDDALPGGLPTDVAGYLSALPALLKQLKGF